MHKYRKQFASLLSKFKTARSTFDPNVTLKTANVSQLDERTLGVTSGLEVTVRLEVRFMSSTVNQFNLKSFPGVFNSLFLL